MNKNVLVLLPVSEKDKAILEESGPDCSFFYADRKQLTFDMVQKANIIIGNPPIDMVRASPNLEWLQLNSAGVGEYINEGVLREDVILTNASGAFGLAISECMLAFLLSIYKKLHLYRDNQAKALWKNEGKVKSVQDSVALIVGLGDIGREFARRLKTLGAYTIGIRRKNPDKPDYVDELHFMDQLEALLPKADIVALSLPSTPSTYHVINRRTIGLMKKDAVLINVGRGTAIDTEALCDALEAGHLLGAALDVTDPEPLPAEHRLWKIKNVIITPHVTGGYSLDDIYNKILRIAARNLKAFLTGQEMESVVDKTAGY
jgi:phosphoglycerate dehydrogenase-like enzyme